MKVGHAGGFQIAFFTFALLLLAVPISRQAVSALGATGDDAVLVTKATPFLVLLAIWAVVPPLRRAVSELLAKRIPAPRRAEVAWVALAAIALAFVYAAVMAAWVWMREGVPGVDQKIFVNVDREAAAHLSPTGIVSWLLLFAFLGPVIEEIIFRGFLYRAFEARWGWFASMVLTSTLFGLYHPHFFAAFTTAIVFVCAMRRAGSLWAAIAVHMVTNLALWWPLAGQHLYPERGTATQLEAWSFNILCALFVAIALPTYLWMSRDAALPK